MGIHALITGVLHKDPVARISQTGNQYVTCTLRVEQDGQTVWANVICFDDAAQAELLRLAAGDALSIQGKATPKVYMKDDEARPSLQVTASAVLALQQPKYETRPRPSRSRPKAAKPPAANARYEDDNGFDDPLDF